MLLDVAGVVMWNHWPKGIRGVRLGYVKKPEYHLWKKKGILNRPNKINKKQTTTISENTLKNTWYFVESKSLVKVVQST